MILCAWDVVAYICRKQQRKAKLVTSQADGLNRSAPATTTGLHKSVNSGCGHSRVRDSSQCVDVGKGQEASDSRHEVDITYKVGARGPFNSVVDRVRSL